MKKTVAYKINVDVNKKGFFYKTGLALMWLSDKIAKLGAKVAYRDIEVAYPDGKKVKGKELV